MTPAEIKALRARLDLSLEDFAGRLGVTTRTVRYWEDGSRTPGGTAMLLLEQMAAKAERARAKKGKEDSR